MLTYEDFTAIGKTTEAISKAIREHLASAEYKTAVIADEYCDEAIGEESGMSM